MQWLQRSRLYAGLLIGQLRSNATREVPMVIREAGTNDYPRVMELARALARHVEDPDPGGSADEVGATACGSHPWFECLVAEVNGVIVGFVSFCRRLEMHLLRRSLWIGDLFTVEDARSQGIGRALLAAVASRGLALGCHSIVLEVWRHNSLALAFYERLGARRMDDCVLLSLEPQRTAKEPLSQIRELPGPNTV
jgi:ribosomal protein S18 acetylase RimI-like enzyme